MPSAGFVIFGATRDAGAESHAGMSIASAGALRLSHATIVFTRGSFWPTNDTPEAPKECPATPTRSRSSNAQKGLYAALRPSFTRRVCLAACEVPVVQLLGGVYAAPGFEKKKSSASSVLS